MLKYGKFPYGIGNHITFDVHKPLENSKDVDALIENIEKTVTTAIIPSV
jgi:1-acyl-sn-glycerol-3-phosphate acyltransferase